MRIVSNNNAWGAKFLNLTNDLPFATFYNDIAAFKFNPDGATKNLVQGSVPVDPYIVVPVSYGLEQNFSSPNYNVTGVGIPAPPLIRVFASSPGPPVVFPGTLLDKVKPLTPQNFIANPGLYPDTTINTEPGIYSVALIGSVSAPAASDSAAQLFIVKHNQ